MATCAPPNTPTSFAAKDATAALAPVGPTSIELLDYDGRPDEAIEVSPLKRAKGVELKQALMVRTPPRPLEPAPLPEHSAETERRELERRELERRGFQLTITRARDGLWVVVA